MKPINPVNVVNLLRDKIRATVIYGFMLSTKMLNPYNFLNEKHPSFKFGDYPRYVQRKDARKALHVGDAGYGDRGEVFEHLILDRMKSVKPMLEEVLDNYRVLYYSGQMDIVVAYHLSLNMYKKLQFGAAEEYRNANRYPWYVGDDLAGYVKSAGKFTEVLVRNAGHMVPTDQPKWALDLITKFTRGDFRYPYGGFHEDDDHENGTSTFQ